MVVKSDERKEMAALLKEITLANGHTLQVHDHTRRYFGNYFLVKIEITCLFPLSAHYFETDDAFADAREVIGDAATYRKTIEHMGIESDRVDHVKDEVVKNFISHSAPYLDSEDFPAKFITAEYQKRKNKIRKIY